MSAELTLGAEEELHLVDLDSWKLSARAPQLLSRMPRAVCSAEIHRATVETDTVFAPNIRGSSGLGRTFVHADGLHGELDTDAALGETTQVVAALTELDRPVEYPQLDGEGHECRRAGWRRLLVARVLSFLVRAPTP